MTVHRMGAARIACDSTSSVYSILSHLRLPLSRPMPSTDPTPPVPRSRASLITALVPMDIMPGKENSPCSMAPTVNLLDRHQGILLNRSTTTRHRQPTDTRLRHTLPIPRPVWDHTLRLDPRMTLKGRLNPPSMMIVSVISAPLLMMTHTTRTLMRPSLPTPTRALDTVRMSLAPTAVAAMIMRIQPPGRRPRRPHRP